MRILVISNLFPPDVVGGYELSCGQMVDELRHRGHRVLVLTSTPRAPVRDPPDEVWRVLRYEDTSNPVLLRPDWLATATRALLVDSHNVDLLRQAIEGFDPDVAYLSNLTGIGGLALALAVELSGLPWVWRLSDAVPIHLTRLGAQGDVGRASEFIGRMAGRWVVDATGLLDEVTALGAPLQGQVLTLPLHLAGPTARKRTAWYRGGRPLRCVAAGQLAWVKGFHIALGALSRLAGTHPGQVELDIVGDGPERHRLEAEANRLGLSGQVRFHAQVPRSEMPDWYGRSDVLLFPTETREPFGLVALEAAAQGCVPIVTAGCGITEWLVDGVHLIAVHRDPESFAAAMGKILDGELDLTGFGRRGQAFAPEFAVERLAGLFERELSAAAGTPKPRLASWEDISRMARIGETIAYRLLHPA